ncbi:MAG: cob(I)yrinic acid a,c-diamide adenosyltransferase [Fimbriimonadaceae bacterium]|nr:cob(I)yrinic acid a,c-diamide adenosyltransferase [Fimbriimonadaceae bacterium]
MRIYTRSGDGGETGLYGGSRVAKTNPRIHAVGEIDELNAHVGSARAACAESFLGARLGEVQHRLFDLGAEVGCAPDAEFAVESVGDPDCEELEADMDRMDASLEELKTFVLPGGSEPAARLHLARAVCRRAERALWALAEVEAVRPEPLRYLNRLSDWLFVAARYANHHARVPDVKWIKNS